MMNQAVYRMLTGQPQYGSRAHLIPEAAGGRTGKDGKSCVNVASFAKSGGDGPSGSLNAMQGKAPVANFTPGVTGLDQSTQQMMMTTAMAYENMMTGMGLRESRPEPANFALLNPERLKALAGTSEGLGHGSVYQSTGQAVLNAHAAAKSAAGLNAAVTAKSGAPKAAEDRHVLAATDDDLAEYFGNKEPEVSEAELMQNPEYVRVNEEIRKTEAIRRCHLHSRITKGCKRCKAFGESNDKLEELKRQREIIRSNPFANQGNFTTAANLSNIVNPGMGLANLGIRPEDRKNQSKIFPGVNVDPESEKFQFIGPDYGMHNVMREHVLRTEYFALLKGDIGGNLLMAQPHYLSADEEYDTDQLIEELRTDRVQCVASHIQGTKHREEASPFFVITYAIMRQGITAEQLQRMIEDSNAYVKCCGLLIIRLCWPVKYLYSMLRPFLLQTDIHFKAASQGTVDPAYSHVSLAEYVEELLNSDRFFNTTLPRIPMQERRRFQALMAVYLPLWRKRAFKHSKDRFIDIETPGMEVEVWSKQSDWLLGEVLRMDRKKGVRSTVICTLEDGTTESIPVCDIIPKDWVSKPVDGDGPRSAADIIANNKAAADYVTATEDGVKRRKIDKGDGDEDAVFGNLDPARKEPDIPKELREALISDYIYNDKGNPGMPRIVPKLENMSKNVATIDYRKEKRKVEQEAEQKLQQTNEEGEEFRKQQREKELRDLEEREARRQRQAILDKYTAAPTVNSSSGTNSRSDRIRFG